MERLFRSLKSEWMPNVDYMTALQVHRDINHYQNFIHFLSPLFSGYLKNSKRTSRWQGRPLPILHGSVIHSEQDAMN